MEIARIRGWFRYWSLISVVEGFKRVLMGNWASLDRGFWCTANSIPKVCYCWIFDKISSTLRNNNLSNVTKSIKVQRVYKNQDILIDQCHHSIEHNPFNTPNIFPNHTFHSKQYSFRCILHDNKLLNTNHSIQIIVIVCTWTKTFLLNFLKVTSL